MGTRVQLSQTGGGKPVYYHSMTISATPQEVLQALVERFGGQMPPVGRKRTADRSGATYATQKRSYRLSLPWSPHAAQEVNLDL